jgi:hypothetical protein
VFYAQLIAFPLRFGFALRFTLYAMCPTLMKSTPGLVETFILFVPESQLCERTSSCGESSRAEDWGTSARN